MINGPSLTWRGGATTEKTHNSQPMKTKATTFIKICDTKFVKQLQKEAKRVKYKVKKDDISFTITDPDYDDALIVKGIQVGVKFWACNFSTDYWVAAEFN